MPSGWRILKAQYAGDAFSGEGARRWRGRWHSRGTPVVYLSSHQSLAALEVYVRTQPLSARDEFVAIRGDWDERLMETFPVQKLPRDWPILPPGPDTAAIGDLWVREGRSAVLALPSAIVPAETNYLINPAHPDFGKIRIGKPERFVFDQRLLHR